MTFPDFRTAFKAICIQVLIKNYICMGQRQGIRRASVVPTKYKIDRKVDIFLSENIQNDFGTQYIHTHTTFHYKPSVRISA